MYFFLFLLAILAVLVLVVIIWGAADLIKDSQELKSLKHIKQPVPGQTYKVVVRNVFTEKAYRKRVTYWQNSGFGITDNEELVRVIRPVKSW